MLDTSPGPFTRQHSRSSSQLASLAINSSPSPRPRQELPRLKGQGAPTKSVRPKFSIGDDRYDLGLTPPITLKAAPPDLAEVSAQLGISLQNHPSIPQNSLDLDLGSVTNGSSEHGDNTQNPEIGELAQLVLEKRRQASAPFFAPARSDSFFIPGGNIQRLGVSFSSLGIDTSTLAQQGPESDDSTDEKLGGSLLMVMTPTTAEWTQLGGDLAEFHPSDDHQNVSYCSSESDASSLSDLPALSGPVYIGDNEDPRSPTPPLEFKKKSTKKAIVGSPPTANGATTRPLSLISDTSILRSPVQNVTSAIPFLGHRSLLSESSIRPNLSRGSLTLSGSPTMHFRESDREQLSLATDAIPTDDDLHVVDQILNDSEPLSPAPLDTFTGFGPVNPNKYSAITGHRNIDSFYIEEEEGKGAYGTVRNAKLKDRDGQPIPGSDVLIKYVIKQRILADCWKKHKILGPIPIEIHVLDHLRRVPYMPRSLGNRRPKLGHAIRRDSSSSIKEGTITGHPNICGMLDFFEDREYYYIVMPHAGVNPDHPELPPGQDLFELVDAYPGGLPRMAIRRIFTQVVEAVVFLHDHDIVHRDIKDENIVLDKSGKVRLIDFGSAAYSPKEGKKFETFSGTLDFAAPEVLRGQRYGGKETDVWALGVLGYVLIQGECPFYTPEEAMQGLASGSRTEKCLLRKLESPTKDEYDIDEHGTEISQGLEERFPGCGQLEDAIDLVKCCLEVSWDMRPPAEEILWHRFIIGTPGWVGRKGWLNGGHL